MNLCSIYMSQIFSDHSGTSQLEKKKCANRQDRYETFYELEEGGTDAKTNIFLILIM